MGTDRTWKEVVRDALQSLGGKAHLDDITRIALADPKAATHQRVAEKARQVVRAYEEFQAVADGSGLYRLVRQPDFAPTQLSSIVTDEIQGMLLSIGKLYGYGVYAPPDDRTKRRFQGKPLAAIADIKADLTPIVGMEKSRVVGRIDVLWFDTDAIGLYPRMGFEVEHTTRIDTGLTRLAEMPDRFNTQLYIIGDDEADRRRFSDLLTRNVYKPIASRVQFHTFDDVRTLYQNAVAYHAAKQSNQQAMQHFGLDRANSQA